MCSKLHQEIVWESNNVIFLEITIEHGLKYDNKYQTFVFR